MGISINDRDILKLAFPAIISGIAEPLISLTDVAVIGNMNQNSVDGLLAVGIVGSFLSAVVWTLAQTKTSISSIVSRHFGNGKLEKVNTVVPQALWLNILLGILLYAITAPLASWIFYLYGAKGEALRLCAEYYQVRAIGFPFTLAAFSMFGIFRGLQNTSWAMIASITGAVLNIGLDYLLVYGYDGHVPAFGLMGAAYASLAAQFVMMVIALVFYVRNTPFNLRLGKWKPVPLLYGHFNLTTNFFLRTVAINVAIFLSYKFSAGYSEPHGATHAILMNVWLFFSFFIDGFANAGNAMGGRLLGAGDSRSLHHLSRRLLLYGIGVSTVLTAGCFILYDQIGRWFTESAEVYRIFLDVFWIVLVMQPINAIAFVFDGIFKGWGEAIYLRNLLAILTIAVFIPVLLVGDYWGLELWAVWFAFFGWMLFRGGVLWWKFDRKIAAM